MAHNSVITGQTAMNEQSFPMGNPISSRIPAQSVGNLLQVKEFFCRFQEVLGLGEPLSFEKLEKELTFQWHDACGRAASSSLDVGSVSVHSVSIETVRKNSNGKDILASVSSMANTLTRVHNSLLGVLVSELQARVALLVDPTIDVGLSKLKRGCNMDEWVTANIMELDMLPINELTWPEMVRRYILAYASIEGKLELVRITSHDGAKVIRCLQGDGGVLYGALSGVAGLEADALLLGRAIDNISRGGSLSKHSLDTGAHIPEWAKALDPVRRLPSNVGSKIRNCVYEALSKGPPKREEDELTHSVSKGVYKGNAAGPTKKAVDKVLTELIDGLRSTLSEPDRERTRKRVAFVSKFIMKKCHVVWRHVAAADCDQVFCDLVGRKLFQSNDSEAGGVVQSLALSRPIDMRTIDLKLLHDAYAGSHEAFLEDVRELWTNLRIAYMNKPTLVELAQKLSRYFQSLYEKEVATPLRRLEECNITKSISVEMEEEIEEFLSAYEISDAPWETAIKRRQICEGRQICKVCGIDRDDDEVLLCDECNEGYHTYCLNPPLSTVPKGNWYCPSCAPGKQLVANEPEGAWTPSQDLIKKQRADIATALEETEYWELGLDKKIFLLNFLCEELLNSALIRQHLAQTRMLEPKDLKSVREEFLGSDSAGRLYWGFPDVSPHHGIVVNSNVGSGTHISLEDCSHESGAWHSYHSDSEIDGLVSYLENNDPDKKELRESILHWKRSRLQGHRQSERYLVESHVVCSRPADLKESLVPNSLITKATSLLEAKCKAATTGPKMRRCGCFEPFLQSRQHCRTCHRTFFTHIEFVLHKNNNCISISSAEKGKVDNGLSKYATVLVPDQLACSQSQAEERATTSGHGDWAFNNYSLYSLLGFGGTPAAEKADINCMTQDDLYSDPSSKVRRVLVPESSSKRLQGKASEILAWLKICLLDVEAALPDGARRTSKASSEWLSAWSAFLKSATTIYELVVATVLLEDMIKSEYVKDSWWSRWSSVSAAVRISTLSGLALRIYSLDKAIDYEKVPVCSGENAAGKRKDQSHRTKKAHEPSKKRKELKA